MINFDKVPNEIVLIKGMFGSGKSHKLIEMAKDDKFKPLYGCNNVYTFEEMAKIRHESRDELFLGVRHMPYYYHNIALIHNEKCVFIDDVEVFVSCHGIQSLIDIVEGASKLFMTSCSVEFIEALNNDEHSHMNDMDISVIKFIESIPGCESILLKASENKFLPDGYVDAINEQYNFKE